MKFLTEKKRDQTVKIVSLREAGHSWRQIFHILYQEVPLSVIKYRYKRFKQDGLLNERPGRGRKRTLSKRQERLIIQQILHCRRMTLAQIKQFIYDNFQIEISRASIGRLLQKANVKSYVPIEKPLLTKEQRSKRFLWAKAHRNWTKQHWRKVIFSDESVFRTNNHRRTNRMWRRKHEKYNRECINSKVKHPLSIQVWGAISYYGKSQLQMVNGNLNSIKYQTEILGDIKLKCDCMAYPIKNYIFMHDKAPCHFSASTQRFMADRGVDVLPWPGNSPDLNPIEKSMGHYEETGK